MLASGEKVLLRPFTGDDFARVVAWGQDDEVNRYIDGNYPTTIAECPAWLEAAASDRHTQLFAVAIRATNELIGEIELNHITWRSGDAEMRIRIGQKEYWDRGYGTDAVRTLLAHAFQQLNLSRVYLRVLSANQRAIRCYEKAGFSKEGRLRRRNADGTEYEVLLMRILSHEYQRRLARAGERRTA